MRRFVVTRTDGVVEVLLLPHKDGTGYSYVNLTKGHICPCVFKTESDALHDMHSKQNILNIIEL